jgi:tetratricopeptide (TPR) repeat protein
LLEVLAMRRWIALFFVGAWVLPPGWAADDSLGEAQALLLAQRAQPDAAQFERAIEIVTAEVERTPQAVRAWMLLAWARMLEHRFGEALEAAQTAERLAPAEARTLALMSDALVELGRYPEAVTVTQQLADTSPGVPAWIRAAHLRFLLGDLEGAIEFMSMAARAGSPHTEENAWTWLDLARLYLQSGNRGAAASAIAAAENAFPRLPGLLAAKARLRIAEGDRKAALDLYRKSLSIQPNAEEAFSAWRLALQLGEGGAAKHYAALLEALAKLDQKGLARRVLAEYFAACGDLPRALTLAGQELDARPDVYTHATLARVLHSAGRAEAAQDHARHALAFATADRELRTEMEAILAVTPAPALPEDQR